MPERAPLGDAIAKAEVDGLERHARRAEGVRLLGVPGDDGWRQPLAGELVEPRVVGMCEWRTRNQHERGPLDRSPQRLPYVVLVAMPVEVDAAEGEPPRRDAENPARDAVLLSTCIRGSAFGEKA